MKRSEVLSILLFKNENNDLIFFEFLFLLACDRPKTKRQSSVLINIELNTLLNEDLQSC